MSKHTKRTSRDESALIVPEGATDAFAVQQVEATAYAPRATDQFGRVVVVLQRPMEGDTLNLHLQSADFVDVSSGDNTSYITVRPQHAGHIEALALAILRAFAEARRLGIIPAEG
jgi:L-aminopeptidase/D-esterase-like protein